MAQTRKEQIEDKVLAAAVLGTIAFNEGRSVPCFDPKLMDLLNGLRVGEGLPVLKAWTRSWDAANLAQSIDG